MVGDDGGAGFGQTIVTLYSPEGGADLLPTRGRTVCLFGMKPLVFADEGEDAAGGNGLVHDDLTVGVEDDHRGSAMDIVGFLVVDIDIVAAYVDKWEIVLTDVFFPFCHIGLIANGVDLEGLVARAGERVVERDQRGRLLLAVVTIGIPEPEDDCGREAV